MHPDERSDELAASLGGFYRCWVAYIGLELGLFERLRDSGEVGLTATELAGAADCVADPIGAWVRAAHATDLVELRGDRARIDPDMATVLLDENRAEFLGGQVVSAVVSTLDYDRMVEFFRSGRPIAERPPRFHRAIERVTVQDISVFFQEGLAALPALVDQLSRGCSVLDVACGGGRWLIAVAKRFPATRLVGVEFEPDSVARALRHVAEAGLEDRITIEAREIARMGYGPEFGLVYLQDALHELPDPIAGLAASWAAVAPGGRLVVFEWCLPSEPDDDVTLEGQLLWGIQLDELYQGTRMYTLQEYVGIHERAGVPEPSVVDLPAGATLFVTTRPA
ncbi:MAG: methyltransferase domain-containing protein [Chloroflexi bacterium]|nr:MAG: methyltransferase domain-containing protein [Chloroflexota bacterium]